MPLTGLSPRSVVHQSFLCHPDWDAQVHHGFLLNNADECFERDEVPPIPVIREWLAEERLIAAARLLRRDLEALFRQWSIPGVPGDPGDLAMKLAAALREEGLLP